MITKRKKSKCKSSEGINYIRRVVENDNSIFQVVELENDIGNYACIEFIVDEEATGCFVWIQIKSGSSYKRKEGYVIPADRDHFEYWNSNIAPVVGIVYDPEIQSAFWINISNYIRENPSIVESGSYTLHIPRQNELSFTTFSKFKDIFLCAHGKNRSRESFGYALECFASMNEENKCLEGLITLFVSYRNKKATWFYFINSFSSIENEILLFQMTVYLSILSGHMDLFRHKGNFIDSEVESYAKSHLARRFGITEIVKLLSLVDESGFSRGSIGYEISTIISLIPDSEDLLEMIALNDSFTEQMRIDALFLFVYSEQFRSTQNCINLIDAYFEKYPHTGVDDKYLFSDMKTTLGEIGFLGYIGTY